MIRGSRNGRYRATSGAGGHDTDALQTDVMRFMSILGLCLMAVFALVQSLPLQGTDTSSSAVSDHDRLVEALALQRERAQHLEAELNRLTEQVGSAKRRKSSAQQALSSVQQQLTLLVKQTQQARSDRDRVMLELQGLQRRLAQERDELAGIEQAARNKAGTLSELQHRLGETQKKLSNISQRVKALNHRRATTAVTNTVEQRPSPAGAADKRGFTLRFASAEALDRLVAADRVRLYAMADKQAWRLSLGEGGPRLAREAFPRWYHEMSPSTVPPAYLNAVAGAVNPSVRSSLVWGVQLPTATKQGIASLTRGLQGGDLVIAADGRVTLGAE